MLRPLVENLFADRLSPAEMQELLTLIFYPRETLERLGPSLPDAAAERAFCRGTLRRLFTVVRTPGPALHRAARRPRLSRGVSRSVSGAAQRADRRVRPGLLRRPHRRPGAPRPGAVATRLTVRRGAQPGHRRADHRRRLLGPRPARRPRGRLPAAAAKSAFIWGNHDAAWLGACLGHEALIAHVLRISCRYRRLSQLEEGYGIPLQPLEHLVRAVYADDPRRATSRAARGCATG